MISSQSTLDIAIQVDVTIPLQSGNILSTILYRPAVVDAPLPVLLAPNIYAADVHHARGCYFARAGYIFLSVEIAGRGSSEGPFTLWANDGREGEEVVAWIGRQPWCDGSVAFWGGSNNGFYQWATLNQHPSHLKTMVPSSAVCPGVDFPAFNNIFYAYGVRWLTFIHKRSTYSNLFNDEAFWGRLFYDHLHAGRSFATLSVGTDTAPQLFLTWLTHPRGVDIHTLLPSPESYATMDIPILTIVGYYDADQIGGLHYYREHMRYGSDEAKRQHYLILGPWDHTGTRTPSANMGGLTVGESSIFSMNDLHRDWYDWILKAGDRPAFLQDRVMYYVMGADEWRHAPELEAIPTNTDRLYFHTIPDVNDGRSISHAGILSREPLTDQPTASYRYDPTDMHIANLGALEYNSWVTDSRYVDAIDGTGLIYHTAVFTEPFEIVGFIRCALWIGLNVPDTDFHVAIYEIVADGTSVMLTQDMLRARHRTSLDTEALIETEEPLLYEFNTFRFVARQIASGSFLRWVITAPDPLQWQRNYNGGGDVASESRRDARVATVRLFQSHPFASVVELPVTPTTTMGAVD